MEGAAAELHVLLGLEGVQEDLEGLAEIVDVCEENAELHSDVNEDKVEEDSSLPPVADPHDPADAALVPEIYDPSETYEAMLARLGLRPGPHWSFQDAESGDDLGYIRFLPSGRSLKATCRKHAPIGACSFFVNIGEDDFRDTSKRLVAWLARCRAENTTAGHLRHKCLC